jgi:CRISPR-associated protein Cmr1
MRRLKLELTTVTPAFIGTSDSQRAEWSAKGVRGQLRWWLRAVLGGELRGDETQVRKQEVAIFGSNEGKSAVRIIARPFESTIAGDIADGRPVNETELATVWGATNPAVRGRLRLRQPSAKTNPIGYLGYGPIGYSREKRSTVYLSGRIRPGQVLRLLLQWNRSGELALGRNPLLDGLQKSLWCWLHLGGIGGRSRRGFGSLALSAVRPIGGDSLSLLPIQTIDQFEREANALLSDAIAAHPTAEWSHFTTESRVYMSTLPYPSWEAALSAAGAWLIAFRRRYGLSSDERPAKRNRDYVWLNSPPPTGGVPDRAGFGLPLPFGKGDLVVGWRKDSRKSEETGRRGSPLLFHAAKFGNDHYLVLTHLPARLVPDGTSIHFHGAKATGATPEQLAIVTDFLNDLESKVKSRIRRIL